MVKPSRIYWQRSRRVVNNKILLHQPSLSGVYMCIGSENAMWFSSLRIKAVLIFPQCLNTSSSKLKRLRDFYLCVHRISLWIIIHTQSIFSLEIGTMYKRNRRENKQAAPNKSKGREITAITKMGCLWCLKMWSSDFSVLWILYCKHIHNEISYRKPALCFIHVLSIA